MADTRKYGSHTSYFDRFGNLANALEREGIIESVN